MSIFGHVSERYRTVIGLLRQWVDKRTFPLATLPETLHRLVVDLHTDRLSKDLGLRIVGRVARAEAIRRVARQVPQKPERRMCQAEWLAKYGRLARLRVGTGVDRMIERADKLGLEGIVTDLLKIKRKQHWLG